MTQTRKISVGIIEQNHVLREGLTAIIRSQKDMIVAFSMSSLADRVNPADVILLQWEASGNLRVHPQGNSPIKPKMVVFNADLKHDGFIHRIRCGARGFILPNSTEQEIVDAVRSTMETEWAVPQTVAVKVFSEITNQVANFWKLESTQIQITGREYEIIQLIGESLSNKEIAEKLNISLGTVKTHVHQILSKAGLQKRAHLSHYLRKELAGMRSARISGFDDIDRCI